MRDSGRLTDCFAQDEEPMEEKIMKSPLPEVISFDLEQRGESMSGEEGTQRSKEFWLTATFAVIFFLVGFVSLVVSFDWFLSGHQGWMQFFFIGAFLIIPGGYATFHILGILMKLPGFNYEAISNWES